MGVRPVRPSHIKLFQITPPPRQWFPNSKQPRFLTACRRLQKLVLPSVLSCLMMWNLQSYPMDKWMWFFFFGGGKQILWSLLHTFRGQVPNSPGSTPWFHATVQHHSTHRSCKEVTRRSNRRHVAVVTSASCCEILYVSGRERHGNTNSSPSAPVPEKKSSHHCWYKCQSTFNECLSPIFPECRRRRIILHCRGDGIEKKVADRFFCQWKHSDSSIP